MKTIFGFIAVITLVGVSSISASPENSSRASFLTGTDISKAVRRVSAIAATDQPLRTVDGGTANVGIFIVHRPQEPDQGCTIEHDTLVNDKTTSIFLVS